MIKNLEFIAIKSILIKFLIIKLYIDSNKVLYCSNSSHNLHTLIKNLNIYLNTYTINIDSIRKVFNKLSFYYTNKSLCKIFYKNINEKNKKFSNKQLINNFNYNFINKSSFHNNFYKSTYKYNIKFIKKDLKIKKFSHNVFNINTSYLSFKNKINFKSTSLSISLNFKHTVKFFWFNSFNKKKLIRRMVKIHVFKYNSIIKKSYKIISIFYNSFYQKLIIYKNLLVFKFISINFLFTNFLYKKINKIVKFEIKGLNKKHSKNVFINYFISLSDFFKNSLNSDFSSNRYFLNYINLFNSEFFINNKKIEKNNINNQYSNYYPIIMNKDLYSNFFKTRSKYNLSFNAEYVIYSNKLILQFLENLFKKSFFIKINNNSQYKTNKLFSKILEENKTNQPSYFKNFYLLDLLNIVWYSFFLKDLSMLSEWVSRFMETLNFKNHKKFLSFFHNLINKYSSFFINILNVKGFFFDIRGKVGVTGSSKKRHFFFKIGSLNRSTKKNKINFNHNLVRTYSGVMGLTYILNY